MRRKKHHLGDPMPIIPFGKKIPKIDSTAFISESSTIIGDVVIGAKSSIWPNVVVRGDSRPIRIGRNTNIQDCVVIHEMVRVGNNVTVGHSAVLHGCEVDDNSLIGIHAVILNKAKIESWTLVGAGALVPPNMVVPQKSLVIGVPGKVVRQLTDGDLKYIEGNAKRYAMMAEVYRTMDR